MPIVLLTDEERLGTTVAGRYRLESVIGSGGMAVVFRGKHTWTGRSVAVKFLDPRRTKDVELASRRFLKEGRVIGALKHPNIVQVLDMGRDEHGIVFQVLELLKGHTLAGRLDEDGRLTAQETLDVLVPIMDALTAAHELEIVHRDIKPENIFISFDESGAMVPKLLDFGVAKGLDQAEERNLTREGSVLGTPYYMAPEQARGASTVAAPADIFSLGAVAYECIAGQLPFGDRDPGEYAVELMSSVVPPIGERVPHLDEHIAAAIDRALQREVVDRPQKMIEFRQALSKAATAAGLSVPLPAVYAPQARAELLAMGDDDPAETLGDDSLLSDLLAADGRPVPPQRTSLQFKAIVAVLSVLAVALGFFLAEGLGDGDSATSPTPGSAPVGTEPVARAVPPDLEDVEDAVRNDRIEEGIEGPAGPGPGPAGDPEPLEAADEGPVIRRIGVRRSVERPAVTRRGEMSPGTRDGSAESPESEVITAEPPAVSPMAMRRGDVPDVVRQF